MRSQFNNTLIYFIVCCAGSAVENSRPVYVGRGGGVRGGSLEPPFWEDFKHRLTVHFKFPSV